MLRRLATVAGHQVLGDIFRGRIDDAGGAGFLQQQQAALDLVEPLRHLLDIGSVLATAGVCDDGFLGARQIGDGFLQHHVHDLVELGPGQVFIDAVGGNVDGASGAHGIHRRLDEQQGAGNVHQHGVRRHAAVLQVRGQFAGLFHHGRARGTQAQHAERIAQRTERLRHAFQGGGILATAAQGDVELVLETRELFLDRHRHGGKQVGVLTGQAFAGGGHFFLAGQQGLKAIGGLDGLHAFAAPGGAGHVEQQVFQQFDRRFLRQRNFTVVDQALDLAVHLPHQSLDRHAVFEAAGTNGVDDAGGDPPQAHHARFLAEAVQGVENVNKSLQRTGHVATTEPAQQANLKTVSEFAHAGGRLVRGQAARDDIIGQRRVDVRREHGIFGQQVGAAHGAQVVQ